MTAYEKLLRANREAIGYIELAMMLPEESENREKMKRRAIGVLSLLDDDELVDQLYDEDMEEQKRLEDAGVWE